MKPPLVFSVPLLAVAAAWSPAQTQTRPADRQIQEAVAPLPEPLRAGATVLGYRDGRLVPLRDGADPMICLADTPGDDRFHVACYHRDLEPFMARGRALRAAGITERAAIDSVRRAEIDAGTLPMPQRPTALYSLTGPAGGFDPATGTLREARGLYVVYMPYATEQTTGIPTAPSRERPWLMFPGEPWAHIMISR